MFLILRDVNFFSYGEIETLLCALNVLNHLVGCKRSSQSSEIYVKTEQLFSLITDIMIKVSIFFTVFIFVGSAMFPILYAVFEFPSPDLWYLPLGYR